jgi:hypothetical protein
MSTLQCPATLLLTAPDVVPPPGLRVTHTWSPEEEPGLLSDDLPTLRDALAGIADRTPGETTQVPLLDQRLRDALPRLARVDIAPEVLAGAPALTLEVDADDWVLRSAEAQGPSA